MKAVPLGFCRPKIGHRVCFFLCSTRICPHAVPPFTVIVLFLRLLIVGENRTRQEAHKSSYLTQCQLSSVRNQIWESVKTSYAFPKTYMRTEELLCHDKMRAGTRPGGFSGGVGRFSNYQALVGCPRLGKRRGFFEQPTPTSSLLGNRSHKITHSNVIFGHTSPKQQSIAHFV